jgi:catechol 2,3-dioxygenase-like lactoylglutathione lyase family enzyme
MNPSWRCNVYSCIISSLSLIVATFIVISSGFCAVDCTSRIYRQHLPQANSADDDTLDTVPMDEPTRAVPPNFLHHTAIKTRNITMAISFYSLFGYEVECRFRAGPARAVWLRLPEGGRLELIEVPSYMLQQPRAPNLLVRPDILGYNHMAIDVSAQIQKESETDQHTNATSLTSWIQGLNQTSIALFNKTLRTAVYPPQQQIIGSNVYEIAFLYDADGCLIELLHNTASLPQRVLSGWEPWNGTDFTQ